MKKWGSFLLEMLRLWLLFMLSMLLLGQAERFFYQVVFGQNVYFWTMTVGNLLIFLVLYRNYFQFKGWFKSKNNKKLHGNTTLCLIALSIGLILLPIWL